MTRHCQVCHQTFDHDHACSGTPTPCGPLCYPQILHLNGCMCGACTAKRAQEYMFGAPRQLAPAGNPVAKHRCLLCNEEFEGTHSCKGMPIPSADGLVWHSPNELPDDMFVIGEYHSMHGHRLMAPAFCDKSGRWYQVVRTHDMAAFSPIQPIRWTHFPKVQEG